MGHYVYKYVLQDEIIYIGKNDTNLHNRIASHGKPGDNIDQEGWSDINRADVYYIKLANSVMSDVVEKELIRRYKPKYNKAAIKTEWIGIPFAEPEWTKYVPPLKPQHQKQNKRKEQSQIKNVSSYEGSRIIQELEHNIATEPLLRELLSKIRNYAFGNETDTSYLDNNAGVVIKIGALPEEELTTLIAARHQTLYSLKNGICFWSIHFDITRQKTERHPIYFVRSSLSSKELIKEIRYALQAIKCMNDYYCSILCGDFHTPFPCIPCTLNCKSKELLELD